jgi:hypothetical protein
MKPLALLPYAIAVLSAAASTVFFLQMGSAKEQLRQESAQAATQATALQTQLTEAAARSEVLQKKLGVLDSDLGQAKSQATAAEARGTQLARETTQLRNQLAAKTDSAQALAGELGQLKQELAQVKLNAATTAAEQSEDHKTSLAALQSRVAELEAAAAKPSLRGNRANRSSKTAPGANGSLQPNDEAASYPVLSIAPANAFVVINAGVAQGIEPKQKLVISRAGQTLAEAVVSSCDDNFSIAQIVSQSLKGNLAKGDLATFEP